MTDPDEAEIDEMFDDDGGEAADDESDPGEEGSTERRETIEKPRRERRGPALGARVEVTVEWSRKGGQPHTASARGVHIEVGDGSSGCYIDLQDRDLRSVELVIVAGEDGPYVVSLNDFRAPKRNGSPLPLRFPLPLREGDRLEVGKTVVDIRTLVYEKGSDAQYMRVKIIDKCSHCGGPLPLNGPLLAWHCNNCQQTTPVEPEYWTTTLDGLFDEYGKEEGEFMLAFESNVGYATERPRCRKCKEALPVDDVAIGTRGSVFCPACGAANTTTPPPDWLRGACPSVVQLYNAEVEGAPGPDAVVAPQAAKPVMLSCPSCNGALKITTESERTTTCQFCSTDVYLPDDLWKRLHPVKIAGLWYVRFAGLAAEEREDLKKVRRLFARAESRLEKEKRRQADTAAKAAATARAPEPAATAEGAHRPPRERISKEKKRVIVTVATGFACAIVMACVFLVNRPADSGPGWTRVALSPAGTTVNQVYFTLNAPFQFAADQPTPNTISWSSEDHDLVVDVSAVAAIPVDGFQAAALLGPGLTFVTGTAWSDAAGYAGLYKDAANTIVGALSYRPKATPAQVAAPGQAEAPMGRPILLCRAIWRRNTPLEDVAALGDYLREICDSLTVP